ncbi:golgin subfamily A member 6-like protein 7 [Neocloeon triangulifer]|uniref:golgin subfamily A member 6-like protein 7 n=1 Tax=Neocloeon triangulifer TaxID=2078957 RepID=UPI00286F7DA9|nr:golgin subfamily A member 6-like protein 7 [Neocloeon triangulifer]
MEDCENSVSEEVSKISVPEKTERILHDDHSPEICAMTVNLVFGRNERLREQVIELIDKNQDLTNERRQLKKEKMVMEMSCKKSKVEMSEMQKKLEAALDDAKGLRKHLDDAIKNKLDASVLEMEMQAELDEMKRQRMEMQKTLETSTQIQQELKMQLEKANASNGALADRIVTLQTENSEFEKVVENLRSRLIETTENCERLNERISMIEHDVTNREENVNIKEQELQNLNEWLQQQNIDLEEQKTAMGLWEEEKQLIEREMNRLRECNRNMRYELSHPKNKPEQSSLKAELNRYKATEEELRRQLFKSNTELIELQKVLKAHNVTANKRKTLYLPTVASLKKT